jgi:hypothetical protein
MTILDVEPVLMTSANQLMVKLQIDDLFVALILCRAVTRDIMEDGVSPTIKMLRVNVISHSEDAVRSNLSVVPLLSYLTRWV